MLHMLLLRHSANKSARVLPNLARGLSTQGTKVGCLRPVRFRFVAVRYFLPQNVSCGVGWVGLTVDMHSLSVRLHS